MLTPEDEAMKFINADAGFADTKAVLDGARQILMEQFSEDAALLGKLRAYLEEHGVVKSTVVDNEETRRRRISRLLRLLRPSARRCRARPSFADATKARLQVALVLDTELDEANKPTGPNPCEGRIAKHFGITDQGRSADK